MGTRKQRERQEELWYSSELPEAPGHPSSSENALVLEWWCSIGAGWRSGTHRNAQLSESAYVMSDQPLLLALLENWQLLVLVRLAGTENLIDQKQQGVSDRYHSRGLVAPRFRGDPPELVLEEAIPLGRGGPSALGQNAS